MTTITSSEVERLLHHMPACAARATNEWAKRFAHDMAVRARRRNWRPSPKQIAIMRRMVADLFAHADDEDGALIEDYERTPTSGPPSRGRAV